MQIQGLSVVREQDDEGTIIASPMATRWTPGRPIIGGVLLASVLLLILGTGTAAASDKKASRERAMLHRMQQQLQQVQGQMSTLQEEKAKLSGDLEAAGKESKAAEAKAGQLGRALKLEKQQRGQVEAQFKELSQRMTESEKTLADIRTQLDQTSQLLQKSTSEKHVLEGIKVRNEREIALCEDKNAKLYELGRELMVRYNQKGVGDALLQQEPLTGFKQVGIENLLEEYRDKLDDQRVIKAPGR